MLELFPRYIFLFLLKLPTFSLLQSFPVEFSQDARFFSDAFPFDIPFPTPVLFYLVLTK